MDIDIRIGEGLKEAQSLNMIHVQMGKEDIDARDAFRYPLIELPNSRSNVQNQHAAIVADDFDR